MPAWLIAALVTGGGGLLLWLRGLWQRRQIERRMDEARAQVDRAELERDAAGGRAAVAEASAEVLVEHAETQAAGAAVAEEVRDVASAAGPDPAARISAVDDWVRSHAGDPGAVPDRDPPPSVPRRR